MIILMLFFTIIGSWRLSTVYRSRNGDSCGGLETPSKSVKKSKSNLNKATLRCQLVYGILSFALCVVTVWINYLMGQEDRRVPNWMFWFQFVLSFLICLFLLFIGLRTSYNLRQTGVRVKWPIHLTIWGITLSYLTIQLLQQLVYFENNYRHQTIGVFTLYEWRLLVNSLHEACIFGAIWLILYHTQNLNRKTIRLIRTLQLKRDHEGVAMRREVNRQTGDFGQFNISQSMISSNTKKSSTSITLKAQESAFGEIDFEEQEVEIEEFKLGAPDLSKPIVAP